MAENSEGKLTEQTVAIAILISRLVQEIGYARTNESHEYADWLAKLNATVLKDIDELQLPGLPEDHAKAVVDGAKSTIGFILSRSTFAPDA